MHSKLTFILQITNRSIWFNLLLALHLASFMVDVVVFFYCRAKTKTQTANSANF